MGCILDFRVVVEQEEVGIQEGSVSIINCTLEGFPLAVRYVEVSLSSQEDPYGLEQFV